jgi:hypothetical protein
MSRWRGIQVLGLSLVLALAPARARADDGDGDGDGDGEEFSPGERGAVTGIGTLILTSIAGGILMGRARTSTARDVGTNIAGFGFAAAPLAGHLVNGEYVRGAAFTAAPLLLATADLALMIHDPNVIDEQGTPTTRVPFALFFTVGFTSGVLGIVDTFFATARRDARARHGKDGQGAAGLFTDLHVLPSVGRDGGTLVLGGTF